MRFLLQVPSQIGNLVPLRLVLSLVLTIDFGLTSAAFAGQSDVSKKQRPSGANTASAPPTVPGSKKSFQDETGFDVMTAVEENKSQDLQRIDKAILTREFDQWLKLYMHGDMEKAKPYFWKVLDMLEVNRSLNHLQRRAAARIMFYDAKKGDKEGQGALIVVFKHWSQAIEEKLGPEHRFAGDVSGSLANYYETQKLFALAARYRKRQLSIYEKSFGKNSNDLYVPLLLLSEDLVNQKKYSEAEPVIKRCMGIGSHFKDKNFVAHPASILLRLLRESGRDEEARKAARQFGLR